MSRAFACLFVVVALFAAGWSGARAQDDPAAERAAVLAEVQRLLAESDAFAAAERVQAEGGPSDVVRRYGEVFADLYWKAKDVPGCVAMGRAAILYALTKSREIQGDDAETAKRLRVFAQKVSFDVASYAWPGWDEEGLVIGPAELATGLDCARLDLRLVNELGYPPEKHANAHWIVGAQLLAAGRHAGARDAFEASRDNALKAGAADKQWMADGYAAIATLLEKPGDEAGKKRFDTAVAKLNEIGSDDAKYLAQQLADVLKVFSR